MKPLRRSVPFIVLLVLMVAPFVLFNFAFAQAPTGFRGEFLSQFDDVQKKIVDLAEAIPKEKYSWRPAKGVRSVSEVLMHIAGGNYMFMAMLGVKSPSTWSVEKERLVTEKGPLIAELARSFEHSRKTLIALPDADLEKTVKMFGKPSTTRNVLFVSALHLHEHMGQMIAYARMIGVVPPWSK